MVKHEGVDEEQRESGETDIPLYPPGVQLAVLENGFTVIVREDHSAPVAAAQLWCKSGSIHEGAWLGGGLSHVLEHMLFKGTTHRGAGQIDQEVQNAGGYMNAYTSFDHTVYLINVPNTGVKTAVDILCDIAQNATLPPDELANEKQVIRREMDMLHDDPSRQAAKRLFETAFTQSPYRFPIIGVPDIFDELERDDLMGYYQEKYIPGNLFLTIAGDFNPSDVIEQVRSTLGSAKARPATPAVLPTEPPQTGPRELIEESSIQLGHFFATWHIPDIRHPDVAPLDLLATILGGGASSRLFQSVREQSGLVHAIDAWTYIPAQPGIFGISGVMDGERFSEARTKVLDELRRLRNETVTNDEMSKAVKQVTASTYASRKTMQGQANDLGSNWLSANDLNFSERYLTAVKQTSKEDLQRVAQRYLTPDNRTLYALLPTGHAPKLSVSVDRNLDQPIQKCVLPNGLRLLVKEDHRLPFVELRALFQGGVLRETPQNNGITALTSKTLLKGTTTRSAEQIVAEMESVGGNIDSYGGNNSFGVSAETLGSDFVTGLDVLADVILNPAFPEEAIERERASQLAAIREQTDHLLQRASQLMRSRFFGNQGYGLDTHGTEASVSALKREDLVDFHRRLAGPQNCVLTVYGNIEADNVLQQVRKVFGDWSQSEPLPEVPETPEHSKRERVDESLDKKQAVIVIGFPGSTLYESDRYPLDLIQEIYSDIGSRLFRRIRDELGLAYFVGAQNRLGLIPGCFAFFAGTAPDKVDQVEDEMLHEADRVAREGLTAEEVQRAKSKLLGQKKIARQELGSYAMATGLDELYGLGYNATDFEEERIQAVTQEEIKNVAAKYLRTDACVVAIVKPNA